MKTKKKPLSIYIHIPFCIKKCLYCDFLSEPAEITERERYMQALAKEIRYEAGKYSDYFVQTIFIGGGTPSVIKSEQIEELLKIIALEYQLAEDAEITIEVNPGTVDEAKLKAYREMGINRLSIGLQSAQDKELMGLGRIHTAKDFFQTYADAIKSGFNNINVDLMSAIPKQTLASYRDTIRQVVSLKPAPTHISAYSLIIEEGTPFYEQTPELPDEETDREMYKITNDILAENGYHRYEISNYAKQGYECEHNKVYWKRGDYVGFGIGAASMVANVRWSNLKDRYSYVNLIEQVTLSEQKNCKLQEQVEVLSASEQMEEFMFLGLRLTQGISPKVFYETFGKTVEEIYPNLVNKLIKEGLLVWKDREDKNPNAGRIALTELGLDVSNTVMAEFLLT